MKLRNKKTGEIGTLIVDGAYKFVTNFAVEDDAGNRLGEYDSLAELNEEWEDAPEGPKIYWSVDSDGMIVSEKDRDDIYDRGSKQIGNYFATKEEAEKAVEKLKAWKRLKDRHFKFDDYDILNQTATWLVSREYDQYENDIKLLFGGEE